MAATDREAILSGVAHRALCGYGSGMIRTLRAPSFALAACVAGLVTVASPAHAFDDLFARPAVTKADECRNGFLEYRIAEWRRRDRPPAQDEFRSVETVMQDVDPPVLRALAEGGCSNTYRYNFLACAQVDWPEDIDTTPNHQARRASCRSA